MTSAKGNGFVPDVRQRFKEFAEAADPGQRLAHTVNDLETRLQHCESPIEQILLIEITRLLTEYELAHFCAVHPQIWAYFTEAAGDDEPPFWRVVGVRLDFLVCFENNWDHISAGRTELLPHNWRPSLLPLFALECDGRDFHTHEAEIQRDKARDRALTSLGLTTIRFTGTEIFNDPLCVNIR